MERRPGTPSLLRELNDRAALDLLLPGTPLTRTQISEQTRVSKVTVAQMLARLEERGLVTVVGQQEGGRGPNAALYSVVPSSAYVAGLYVELDGVSAGVADVTGRVVAEVSVNPNGSANPVELVRGAVDRACRTAGVEMSRLNAFVIGSPGVVDPRTGDPRLAINLPDWHEGVLGALRGALNRPIIIENDVNLAALAERSVGAAQAWRNSCSCGSAAASAWRRSSAARCTGAPPGPRARSATCPCPARRCRRMSAIRPTAACIRWSARAWYACWPGSWAYRPHCRGGGHRAAVGAGTATTAPRPAGTVPRRPGPWPARRSSSANWRAASRSGWPRSPSSSIPTSSCSAATSAWRAAPPSRAGSRPRWPVSARPAPALSPPASPAPRSCAAPLLAAVDQARTDLLNSVSTDPSRPSRHRGPAEPALPRCMRRRLCIHPGV